jgi:hypothetical protein
MLGAVIKESSDIWAVFEFYATQEGSFLPTFRNMSVPSPEVVDLTFEGGADRFSQNVGKKLPFCPALISEKSTDLSLLLHRAAF